MVELEHGSEQDAKQALATLNEPLVFISCGQSTADERQLGRAIAQLVEQETGWHAYFAENQTSFEAVTENVLKALHRAVAFIAIMHPRGNVSNPHSTTEAPWVRGSVWVEQEIAIAAFITQALRLPMEQRAYVHESIRREGLRDKLHMNPIVFRNDSEILADLSLVLPAWKALGQHRRKGPLSLKATLKHQRVPIPGGGTDDERYLLMAGVENDGLVDATDFQLDVELPSAFLDGGGHRLQVQSANPGFILFQITNRDEACKLAHLYPGTKTKDGLISFHYAITSAIKRQHPELLRQQLTATVFSGNMTPHKTVKTMAELGSGISQELKDRMFKSLGKE
jgi:hypothetical protein